MNSEMEALIPFISSVKNANFLKTSGNFTVDCRKGMNLPLILAAAKGKSILASPDAGTVQAAATVRGVLETE